MAPLALDTCALLAWGDPTAGPSLTILPLAVGPRGLPLLSLPKSKGTGQSFLGIKLGKWWPQLWQRTNRRSHQHQPGPKERPWDARAGCGAAQPQ